MIIGLIKVVSFLLSRQIKVLEQAFIQEGGMRERMVKARLEFRRREGGGRS